LSRHYALLAAYLVTLFLAVMVGTAAALFLINGGPPPTRGERICVPQHALMPEDLGQPDKEAEALGCRGN